MFDIPQPSLWPVLRIFPQRPINNRVQANAGYFDALELSLRNLRGNIVEPRRSAAAHMTGFGWEFADFIGASVEILVLPVKLRDTREYVESIFDFIRCSPKFWFIWLLYFAKILFLLMIGLTS